MSTSRKVHSVSVGEPTKTILSDIETLKFVIFNFKDRKERADEMIESPIVKAHGYEWNMRVHPCFHGGEPTGEYVPCFLALRHQTDVTAMLTWRSKGFGSSESVRSTFNMHKQWGPANFLKREHDLENILEDDGSLAIEVDIQIATENKRIWYPKELQQQDIWVELYQDASSDTSDVIFSVGETIYRVHKSILSLRGKKLYEISNECDSDIPIPIQSTRGEIFKTVLDFVYTVKTPIIETEDIAAELLVAADLYDCGHLKLYVESILVDKFLTAENAAVMLILADSHSCALLKEAAMNLFVTDTETVKQAETWSRIKESHVLLEELLDSFMSSNELDYFDVSSLRKGLEEANLEVDGSREVLYDRLKNYCEGSVTEK